MAIDLTGQVEFRPELLSRRGEFTAWGLALLVIVTWIIIRVRLERPSVVISILAALLLVSAGSISLGNWMDRRTILRLSPTGIAFRNGLRHVKLGWDEFVRIDVYPGSWGDKVRVIAQGKHFSFRTLGEVSVKGDVKGRVGFAAGEQILQTILARSGLNRVESTDERSTYARR